MTRRSGVVHAVVKVGGALLSRTGAFDLVAEALAAFGGGTGRRVLVVPGGGPFADAVRQMGRRIKIGDDAAHWMAILGMDQHAHALAARIANAALVEQVSEIAPALAGRRLPVLAPYRWLRAVDPLPHSWDVTSDSIAAWIAGALGARRLVLIKPASGRTEKLVDPYFLRALPRGVEHLVLTAHDLQQLGEALDEGGGHDRRSTGER